MGLRERSRSWVSGISPSIFHADRVRSHWLDSNLERIAKTFQRPVLGIQNASYGIIFDVLECIIQRTFTYATTDIRTVYQGISELVQDPEVHKVVLIAHSQGCIELGMALDWLYVTRPMTDIAKIEVYTFGNAANHWNCLQHENGQRVIPHVEHYANTSDWVARFGVIFFRGLDRWRPCTQLQKALPVAGEGEVNGDRKVEEEHVDLRNRFVGKLFLRQASGHQFNQHYLNNMFTMNRGNQIVLDSNRFIRSVVKDDNFQDGQVSPSPAADVQKLVNGRKGLAESTRLLQDESRLWQYRNGGAPS